MHDPDPYRTKGDIVLASLDLPACMRPIVINGGKLDRSLPCPAPGLFSRWWNNIEPGDFWTCRCGRQWQLDSYSKKWREQK